MDVPTPGESRPIPIADVRAVTRGLRALEVDLWPIDLWISAYRGPAMD